MRRLPTKPTKNHKLILAAVKDFFGDSLKGTELKSISKAALYVMRRKSGLGKLTEVEKSAVWFVRKNLKDLTYKKELLDIL